MKFKGINFKFKNPVNVKSSNLLSICLSVCLIIAHEPLDRYASNFDEETQKNYGNVF